MPSKAELRAKWDGMEENKVVLHMFKRSKIKPNGSPFVMKLETYLRMAGIDYETDFEVPMSTKGKTPWYVCIPTTSTVMLMSLLILKVLSLLLSSCSVGIFKYSIVSQFQDHGEQGGRGRLPDVRGVPLREAGEGSGQESQQGGEGHLQGLQVRRSHLGTSRCRVPTTYENHTLPRVMLEEHFIWTFATLEWVFNKGKYLKTHFPPLPFPSFIPQSVAWNIVGKTVRK